MSRRNHSKTRPQVRKSSRVNGSSTPRNPRELDAIKSSFGALLPTVGSAR